MPHSNTMESRHSGTSQPTHHARVTLRTGSPRPLQHERRGVGDRRGRARRPQRGLVDCRRLSRRLASRSSLQNTTRRPLARTCFTRNMIDADSATQTLFSNTSAIECAPRVTHLAFSAFQSALQNSPPRYVMLVADAAGATHGRRLWLAWQWRGTSKAAGYGVAGCCGHRQETRQWPGCW